MIKIILKTMTMSTKAKILFNTTENKPVNLKAINRANIVENKLENHKVTINKINKF